MNSSIIIKEQLFGFYGGVGLDYKDEIIKKTDNDKKEELLHDINQIIEVLPIEECKRIYDYLSELYFA